MKNGVAKQLDLIKNAISIPKAPTYNGPSYETLKPQYDALKSKVDAWQIQMVNLQNQITIVNSGSVEINPDIYNHIEDMIADLTTKYSNLLDTMSDKAQMPTIDAFVNSLIKKADNIFHSQF